MMQLSDLDLRPFDKFCETVAGARAGDRVIYHCGYLARDRDVTGARDGLVLDAVAEMAWWLGTPVRFIVGSLKARVDFSGLDVGTLLQHRLDKGRYEYILKMRRVLLSNEIQKLREHGAIALRHAVVRREEWLEKAKKAPFPMIGGGDSYAVDTQEFR